MSDVDLEEVFKKMFEAHEALPLPEVAELPEDKRPAQLRKAMRFDQPQTDRRWLR